MSVGHGENLMTLETATELYKKLGKILTAVARAKRVPQQADSGDEKNLCEDCQQIQEACICHIPQDLEPHFSRT